MQKFLLDTTKAGPGCRDRTSSSQPLKRAA